ncbi:MAG: methylated-DNA--[Oscillospiraceae bacterium]|nr:methylated-DNA--[protein]-cysteine S-methyltransferase [Oscillospiraceae bacterium]
MNRITFDSPIGKIEIREENGKITRIDIAPEEAFPETETAVLLEAKEQLSEYFSGRRENFDFPFEFSGTDFQKSVWRELIKIPFGKTKTYGEIAAAVGKPKAARAVGGACNKNHILIAVPCHRVIGFGGKMVGFAWGTDMKKWLLGHEAGLKGEHNED